MMLMMLMRVNRSVWRLIIIINIIIMRMGVVVVVVGM